MADMATLVYDIDSSQAAGAARALLQMERAAASAETGAARLDRTYRGANGRFIATADAAKQNEQEIRRLAAAYNTGLSAQLAFADAEREVARAVQLGVIAADQQEAVLAGLASQYSRTTAAANGYAAGMQGVNNVQASVGNQFAQLNDVVVTAWGGMNPALIGMQQGMQMVQGFAGQSLPQALGTLRGAFAQLLSPMTLLTVGAIAGGAALLQWGLAAFDSETKAKSLSESVDDLKSNVQELQRINSVYTLDGPQSLLDKYGELNGEILLLLNRQREFATNEAMRSAAAVVSDTANELGRLGTEFQTALTIGGGRLRSFLSDMGLTFDEAIAVRDAIRDVKDATDLVGRTQALARLTEAMRGTKLETKEVYGLVLDTQSEMRVLYNETNKSGWFAAAQAGANSLLGTVRQIIAANIEAAKPGQTTGDLGWATGANGFLLPGAELLPPAARGESGGGGRGGSSSVDALRDEQKRRWEVLNEGFRAESALTMAQYAEDQATLKWALDQKLITEQMYQQRRQELQVLAWGTQAQQDALRYQTEIAALDAAFSQKLIAEEAYLMRRAQLQNEYYSGAITTDQNATAQQLSQMSAAFGQMNQLAGGGYNKLLRAQQTFAAGSALINAYLAATQALADPSVPFWAKAAAYAKTLAAGLGAVNAIKGGGSGGGGGRGSSAAASATRAEPQRQVLVRLQGDDWLVGMAETIMDEIYKQSQDGRVVVVRDN